MLFCPRNLRTTRTRRIPSLDIFSVISSASWASYCLARKHQPSHSYALEGEQDTKRRVGENSEPAKFVAKSFLFMLFAARGDLQGIFDCGQDQEHGKKV